MTQIINLMKLRDQLDTQLTLLSEQRELVGQMLRDAKQEDIQGVPESDHPDHVLFFRVSRLVAEMLGVHRSEIKPSTRFIHDLGGDSLDLVEVVIAVEDEFNFEIPDDEADELDTVNDIIEMIKKHGAA